MQIITAWQHISPEVTVNGFKKWYIVNAVVGTEGDTLWNDREEDGNVRSECEEDRWRLTLIGKGR
jgi:hypothetical protein